ncbi:MAG: Calx-beta domain-containing protein, partial [Candidatus Bipolaricaulia bacterium]
TWRFEATYIVQRDDPTSLGNTGCVNGVDVDTQAIPQACDNHTTTVNHNPLLEIDKQGPASANVGDTVTYVFFVSHAAGSDGSDVSSITVSDTVAGAASYVSGDDGDTLLEASETWRFEATYIVQRDDPTSLGNTGCVNGVDVATLAIPQACDNHTTTVNHNPLLKIVKAGSGGAVVGQTVTYTFAVSHDPGSDSSPVDSLSVSDDVAGSASLVSKTGGDQDSFLELGEVWNYSADYTIQPSDADPLENVGCVSGQDLDNQIVSDCDTHTTDLTPQIRVSDVSVTEGDTATFTVTLSNPSASTVTVDYLTGDGTAQQPGDYTLSSGTVAFLPGETSREVPVPTIEDLIDEDDETFDLSLSGASNATIADPLGVGTILDDDGAPSISMNDVNVNEGDTASFTVRLSNPSASTITVDYLTSDGTASQPGDYTLSSGTVTFLPGETSKPITVPTVEDLIDEADETFDVNLSNAANAAIADPLGVGTILDDDGSPSISIDDVPVAEGDTATFTVSLSNPSASTVTVDYVTSDGTAEQPGDYTLSSGTVTFLPGETSKPITVPTIEDLIDEPDETFDVNLSNASNASITDPLGVGTILDDDSTPSIVIDDVSVNEGDTATFTVTLSNPSASTITVDYGTSDGTA